MVSSARVSSVGWSLTFAPASTLSTNGGAWSSRSIRSTRPERTARDSGVSPVASEATMVAWVPLEMCAASSNCTTSMMCSRSALQSARFSGVRRRRSLVLTDAPASSKSFTQRGCAAVAASLSALSPTRLASSPDAHLRSSSRHWRDNNGRREERCERKGERMRGGGVGKAWKRGRKEECGEERREKKRR